MSARRSTRRLLLARRILKPGRILQDPENPMEILDEAEFQSRFSLSKQMVLELLDFMTINVQNQRGLPVSPLISVLISLRYFATGSFQIVQADLFAVSQATVSRIVSRISRAIALLRPLFIKLPTLAEIPAIQRDFYRIAAFPGVTAAIDVPMCRMYP